MKKILKFSALVCFALLWVFTLCSCNSESSEDSPEEVYNTVSRSDIIINEVLCSNSTCAKAFDGRYYDWVELYNPTPGKISLDDYYLTDNIDEREKASLKGQEIPPGGYLVIYCSGLDMTDSTGHLHTNFKLSATQGETVFLSNASTMSLLDIPISEPDVSYGLDDDGNYVWFSSPTPGEPNSGQKMKSNTDVIINEYMISNTFTIYDCEGDYGDWVELYNTGGDDINLTGYGITDNDDNPLKYVFPEGASISAGEYLVVFCDGKNRIDDEGGFHTNFSLSKEDETISLYTPTKSLSSTVNIVDMPDNISCGRADGESGMKLFARPTPGKQNTTAYVDLSESVSPDINNGVLISETLSCTRSSKPKNNVDYIEIYNSTSKAVDLGGYTLSQTPGEPFFTFSNITLDAKDYLVIYCDGEYKNKNVDNLHAPIKIGVSGEDFYLADSSGRVCDAYSSGKGRYGMSSGRIGKDTTKRFFFTEPTPGKKNSDKYYAAFAPVPEFSVAGGVVKKGISVSLSAPEGFTIVYTTDGSKPTEKSKVYKSKIKITANTVIRAATFSKNCAISECSTQTYLIENPHTLPIVCISGKKGQLTSGLGILVSENNGTEYEVHFEYLDTNGVKAVEFDCGAKHFGEYSLKFDQKGLRLSLREMYGQTEVSYNFFNQNSEAATTFSSLLLRPSGQDQNRAKLRDELIPAIVRGKIDIDYQEYRACALYVNAQYWGLYYIRERLDANYLESYYGYEKGSYDLVKSQLFAQEGSLKEYVALTKFCKENDLTEKKNYDYICSQVDIDSLINYWIIETYFNNYDTGNIRCYKTTDGKWRWMIYDFDWAMTGKSDMQEKNYIDMHLLDPGGHGSANFDNSIIRKLLANDDFKDKFITTYCYHIQNTFNPKRTVPILNSMAELIDSEIPLNCKRWGYPKYDTWKNKTIPFLRTYLESKPDIAYQQLRTSFKLSEQKMNEYIDAASRIKQ